MDADELRRLYNECGSVSEASRRTGIQYWKLRKLMIGAGIDTHSGFTSPKTVKHYGESHHNWKGGVAHHSAGYIMEYAPNHPDALANKGYVMQHRLIMERHIGRLLKRNECVHHINGIKSDNRMENLVVLTQSDHFRNHRLANPTPIDKNGRFIGKVKKK